MKKTVTVLLQCRGGRRGCVLLFYQFEFFSVLKTANVIHLAQFV